MTCNAKTVDHRAKRSDIWGSWVVAIRIQGNFDFLVFKVILGSFGALGLKIPCNAKAVGCETNQTEIWDMGGGG